MALETLCERVIRCPDCAQPLGTRLGPGYAGLLAMRPVGSTQEIIAAGVVCIRCGCGGVWRPEPPDWRGTLEYKQEAGHGSVR